jgi:hypothetical protein
MKGSSGKKKRSKYAFLLKRAQKKRKLAEQFLANKQRK